jgi:hypothetical protein
MPMSIFGADDAAAAGFFGFDAMAGLLWDGTFQSYSGPG